MLVLDTSVVSALMTPERNEGIVQWLDRQPSSAIWTTAITVYEIRAGLLAMPEGRRREGLMAAFDTLIGALLRDKILPCDTRAAEQAARIAVMQFRSGRDLGASNAMIAGIVVARDAKLATRNTKHFQEIEERLVDPWKMD